MSRKMRRGNSHNRSQNKTQTQINQLHITWVFHKPDHLPIYRLRQKQRNLSRTCTSFLVFCGEEITESMFTIRYQIMQWWGYNRNIYVKNILGKHILRYPGLLIWLRNSSKCSLNCLLNKILRCINMACKIPNSFVESSTSF